MILNSIISRIHHFEIDDEGHQISWITWDAGEIDWIHRVVMVLDCDYPVMRFHMNDRVKNQDIYQFRPKPHYFDCEPLKAFHIIISFKEGI